jgi:hypothetical protein
VQFLSTLQHPNICQVHGGFYGEPGRHHATVKCGVVYSATKMSSLETLFKTDKKPCDQSQYLKILRDIVAAVVYLQAQSPPIYLSSITPANVFVDMETGRAKLLCLFEDKVSNNLLNSTRHRSCSNICALCSWKSTQTDSLWNLSARSCDGQHRSFCEMTRFRCPVQLRASTPSGC